MNKKQYEVPEELLDMMAESLAMEKMRDALVKWRFRFRKAKECAIASEILRARFWQQIQLLYPVFKGKSLNYDRGGFISIIEKPQRRNEDEQ